MTRPDPLSSFDYPQRRSKEISLDQAGRLVAERKVVSICGSQILNAPMALVRAAIRAGASGLTLIPSIDASMSVGDVAVLEDGRLLTERRVAMKDARHERLMPAVAEALEDAKRTVRDVDRIVCGAGPGSFTSLRIAGGIAKGLAAGAVRPLWAVPSLALIVAGAELPMGKYLAALDALRGELYVALYHVSASGEVLELERAVVIAADQLSALAERS